MNVLVIGGSGFIGTRLIDLLVNQKNIARIINFDITLSDKYPQYTVLGDVRDFDSLCKVSLGVDLIYNLAAAHADNITPLSLYHDVNVCGAENIVQCAEKHDIKKIIFTSSVAIYDLDADNPNENTVPCPFNEYGLSKLKAEKVFDSWQKVNTNRTLITVRPSVVFGERNRGNVYNLINQVYSGKFLMVGNGKNKKSMAYVGNVVEFLNQQKDKLAGRYVYNYADKDDLSSSEIINIIKQEMEIETSSIIVPYFIGVLIGYFFDLLSKISGKKFSISSIRIKKFCANTTIDSKVALSSGFEPPYSLSEGLHRMIQHDFKTTTSGTV